MISEELYDCMGYEDKNEDEDNEKPVDKHEFWCFVSISTSKNVDKFILSLLNDRGLSIRAIFEEGLVDSNKNLIGDLLSFEISIDADHSLCAEDDLCFELKSLLNSKLNELNIPYFLLLVSEGLDLAVCYEGSNVELKDIANV